MTYDEMWADLKSKYPEIYITAEQLSDAMKDLDAVCAVRCKDCKYFEEIMIALYRDGTTKEDQFCKKHVPLKDENFYCGWGKRKDEVEE